MNYSVFCFFFFLSQKTEITWQNEMLLFIVVFWHDRLRRALPVRLSQVRLWDVCGRPCWPGRHWKMHNWQWTFNMLYLGNERNSGQLGRVGGDLFSFSFPSFCLRSVWVHPWEGRRNVLVFFTITPDSSRLMFSWVEEEFGLCVNVVRTQRTDQHNP